MRQTEINELDWLTDPNWKPSKVVHHTNYNIGMTNEEFDEQQARSYGYESVEDMNKQNHDHDQQTYLNFGDRTKGLI